jgi:hypothetical protein
MRHLTIHPHHRFAIKAGKVVGNFRGARLSIEREKASTSVLDVSRALIAHNGATRSMWGVTERESVAEKREQTPTWTLSSFRP